MRKDNLPEYLSQKPIFLLGTEKVLQEAEYLRLANLSSEDLLRQPHLYLQYLSQTPQLPAPKQEAKEQNPPQNPNHLVISSQQAELTPIHMPSGKYLTFWGCLNFEEIYEKSYRYAYAILYRDSRYETDSIEDALQLAYLKLWQHLEKDPNLLAERNLAWLGKYLFNSALHSRQREKRRSQRKHKSSREDVFENFIPSPNYRAHSLESRQADIRIDLEAAILATAQAILKMPAGKQQDRALWALYGIAHLKIQVSETSHLFRVNHRAMKQAYSSVETLLREHLQGYAPKGKTKAIHNKGQKALPYQDIRRIRTENAQCEARDFEALRTKLLQTKADTLERDLIALAGIRTNTPARELARRQQISYSAMQRAYERIHLFLAAEKNPSVSPRRIEKKTQAHFSYSPHDDEILKKVAEELLSTTRSQERLVALYAYICNLPSRSTAKQFQTNEASLRRYRRQIHERVSTLRQELSQSKPASTQSEMKHRKTTIQRTTDIQPAFAG